MKNDTIIPMIEVELEIQYPSKIYKYNRGDGRKRESIQGFPA